jgi:hypothetical protein
VAGGEPRIRLTRFAVGYWDSTGYRQCATSKTKGTVLVRWPPKTRMSMGTPRGSSAVVPRIPVRRAVRFVQLYWNSVLWAAAVIAFTAGCFSFRSTEMA